MIIAGTFFSLQPITEGNCDTYYQFRPTVNGITFCVNIFFLVRNPIYSNLIHFDSFWTDLILSDPKKLTLFILFIVTTRTMTVTLMKSAKFHRKPMEMLILTLIARNLCWMAHQKPRYLVQTNYFCFDFAI